MERFLQREWPRGALPSPNDAVAPRNHLLGSAEKAMAFKIQYIEAFNRMERVLRQQVAPLLALDNPQTLRSLLLIMVYFPFTMTQ